MKISIGPNGFLIAKSWDKDASKCKVRCSCPANRNLTRVIDVPGTGSDFKKEILNKVIYCRYCGFRIIVFSKTQSLKDLKMYVEMPD